MKPFTYPHTIENGAGEFLTFERRVPGPKGERIEGHNLVKPGSGPPMHVHYYQDEGFTVQEGRLGYQRLGESEKFAGPGESVTFPAGVPHRFWNAGETDMRCRAFVEPPDNIEYFLGQIFESTKRSGNGRPNMFDAAFLLTRYKSEFGMLVIPPLVQRFVFPIVVAIGHLTGRYKKFADAPEPVRR
jgi:quercetin dioxygenase-like cupin family protein